MSMRNCVLHNSLSTFQITLFDKKYLYIDFNTSAKHTLAFAADIKRLKWSRPIYFFLGIFQLYMRANILRFFDICTRESKVLK